MILSRRLTGARRALVVYAVTIWFLSASRQSGQAEAGEPSNPDFQVNSFTVDTQWYPHVAASPGGRFVVTWINRGLPPGQTSGRSIAAQPFASDGHPVGAEIRVNEGTTGFRSDPVAAHLANGGFIVAWTDTGVAQPERGIRARVFSIEGNPVGSEQQLNAYTEPLDRRHPALAALPDGSFLATWHSRGSPGNDPGTSLSVQGRRLSSDGQPLASDFQMNTYTPGYQVFPFAAPLDDGSFVVSWWNERASESGGNERTVDIRRFALAGDAPIAPLGVEKSFAGGIGAHEIWTPTIAAAADDRFVVAWDPGGFALGLRAKLTTWLAGASPPDITITQGVDAAWPRIAAGPGGEFVIVWQTGSYYPPSPLPADVRARRFDSLGQPVGDEFVVNSNTAGVQQSPEVATFPNGNFVVTWWSTTSEGTDSSGPSIQARRFGPIDPSRIFTDGFESGGLELWSELIVSN